jgi:hypothetical protein
MSKESNEEQEERAGRIVDGRIPFYTGVKPSIQAALDEGKIQLTVTVDDRVAEVLRHTPSVRSSIEHPDDVFDPADPDQQGLPLAGFKVEPGSAPTTAPETSLLDAMRYGTGFTRISSGNEGVEVTNVPYQDMLASYMDFGHAIRCMEAGNRVQREGWNGKGMWIAIQIPDANSKMGLPYIYMSTVTGQLVPWLASQSDMLAKDWRIVP